MKRSNIKSIYSRLRFLYPEVFLSVSLPTHDFHVCDIVYFNCATSEKKTEVALEKDQHCRVMPVSGMINDLLSLYRL